MELRSNATPYVTYTIYLRISVLCVVYPGYNTVCARARYMSE